MKKQFIQFSAVMLIASMACFVSCKDDDPPELKIDPSVTEIVFEASGISLTSGGSTTFTVSTNQGEWNVTSSQTSWLTAIPNKAAKTFTLNAQPNTLVTEPTPATVTVTAGNATSVSFQVKQLPAAPYLNVTPSERTIAFDAEGNVKSGSATFNVNTNAGTWTAVSNHTEWLTVEKGENSFTLVAAAHTSQVAPPAATVTVSAGNTQSVVINVTQDEAQPFLTVIETDVVISSTGGTEIITVETNYSEWNFAKNPDLAWLTVTKEGTTLKLSASANDYADIPSTVTVIITAGTAEPITIPVSQSGNPAGLPKAVATTKPYPIGNQIWTDYIEYNGNNKTDLTSFNGNNVNGDYRNAGTYKGYLYNWYYVNLNAKLLCPSPWRVPSKDDFVALDKALGGDGSNDQTGNTALRDKYINDWGAVYNGYTTAANVLTYQGSYIYGWSSDAANETQAYYLLVTNTGNVQPYGSTSSQAKPGGRPVRCVKNAQ